MASLHCRPMTKTRSELAPLLALIVGQVCLHACMAGVRVAAPLSALANGHSAVAVGLLLALFAAGPIAFALQAGRMADRHGYHRPLRLAVALCVAGGALACVSQHFVVLCGAAVLTGVGANVGLITIQRSAGRLAGDATERMRVFSWLGLAPALANVVGAVTAGLVIDHGGYQAAFAVLMLMPLASLACTRWVQLDAVRSDAAQPRPRRAAWELVRLPALRRLLLVNWLLSASWDVHSFVLPVLGHERGMSASAIGAILGLFAAAVAAIRLVVPLLAHRLREEQVLTGAMLCAAAVFAVYPFVERTWLMAVCATLLGLALGSVQPMIMSKLHHITPADRHGEAIALRSMTINFASSVMPLIFGAGGAALGAGTLFWAMGAAVGAGSLQVRGL
jgi:MFS family permease